MATLPPRRPTSAAGDPLRGRRADGELTLNAGAAVIVDESLGQNAGETEGGSAGLGQVTVPGATLFSSTAVTGQDNEGATVVFLLDVVVGGGATGLFSTDSAADHAVRRRRR